MTQDQEKFLKELYNRLEPSEPLERLSALYEPVYEAYADDTGYMSPVRSLMKRIQFGGAESFHYFSGFNGSGKTTELKRLVGELEQAGYVVLFSNATEYLNTNEPIDITELLYTLAVAFDQHRQDMMGGNSQAFKETWGRLVDYVTRTQVEFKEISFDLSPINVTAELKNSDGFRTRFRQVFQNHVAYLNKEVKNFIQETRQALTLRTNKPIVFIFDSLEKVGSDSRNSAEIQKSIELIFQTQRQSLELPLMHVIYTVPPWLQLLRPLDEYTIRLSGIRLWKNNPERTYLTEGFERVRRLLRRRLSNGDPEDRNSWAMFFGTNPNAADPMILASGGHIRDLIRMLREAILRTETLPIPTPILERAIEEIRRQYLPINLDNARLLQQISQSRNVNVADQDQERVFRLLDTHLALFFQNGQPWYDTLPTIRAEVERICDESNPT